MPSEPDTSGSYSANTQALGGWDRGLGTSDRMVGRLLLTAPLAENLNLTLAFCQWQWAGEPGEHSLSASGPHRQPEWVLTECDWH